MRALGCVLLALACAALAGCDSDSNDPPIYDQPVALTPDTGQAPVSADIVKGAAIDSDPGGGAGVFVEYEGSGGWHVWTTCDTPTSGTACEYTIFTATSGSITFDRFDGAVGAYDGAGPYSPGVLEADFETTSEIDGFRFHADPGATVTVTAWLDGAAEPRALYWYGTDGSGNQVLHQGAPTDPIALTPDVP